jgi:hypothetical protein
MRQQALHTAKGYGGGGGMGGRVSFEVTSWLVCNLIWAEHYSVLRSKASISLVLWTCIFSRCAFIDISGPRPHQLSTCMSQKQAGYELQGQAVVLY